MSKGFKKEKYREQILNEVNAYLRNLSDARLKFVSITSVDVTPDFSMATLHWDTYDASKRGDVKKALESSLGKIRSHLARVMKVKHTPELKLKYDSQFESEQEISKILDDEARQGKY